MTERLREPGPGKLTTSQLTLGGYRTRAIELAGISPTVVLLHGFSDRADSWGLVLQEFARSGQGAVALDLPGYGEAGPLAHGRVLPQYDEFLAACVEQYTRSGQPPVVVGNSLGGYLAMRAANNPAVAVRGLVLIDPGGFAHSWLITVLGHLHRINPLLYRLVPIPVFRSLAAWGFRRAAGGGVPMVPGTVEAWASQFRRPTDIAQLLAAVPLLMAEHEGAWDAQIATPTLVLWGRHDKVTKVVGAESLRAVLKHGHIEILEDCGHCPQLQRPDLIAARIAEFTSGLQPPSAFRR